MKRTARRHRARLWARVSLVLSSDDAGEAATAAPALDPESEDEPDDVQSPEGIVDDGSSQLSGPGGGWSRLPASACVTDSSSEQTPVSRRFAN